MSIEMETHHKLIVGIVILIILSVVLVLLSTSLVYSVVTVENNIFRTGLVDINFNDGNPVISDEHSNFAPGRQLESEFFLHNESSYSVYYKLYFANLEGDMADVIQVTIYNGDEVLYKGTPSALTRDKVKAANDELKINERRTLRIVFTFPEEAGNIDDSIFRFDLCADATQTKNNPEKLFD